MLTHYGLPFLYWLREKAYDFYSCVDVWCGLWEDRDWQARSRETRVQTDL